MADTEPSILPRAHGAAGAARRASVAVLCALCCRIWRRVVVYGEDGVQMRTMTQRKPASRERTCVCVSARASSLGGSRAESSPVS